MGVNRPYRRTYRQSVDGGYSSQWYMHHPKFAESPQHYIRAYLLLQKDLHTIFDFIEPADENVGCYSFRVLELLFRTCVEVEANCRAILKENGYTKIKTNMDDYKKIEKSHRLSSYSVKLPVWDGEKNERKPFESWSNNASPQWYKDYNSLKHDRHATFEKATFENMIDAVSGLVVLLSSQFMDDNYEYGTAVRGVELEELDDGMDSAAGGYFRIKYPDDWPEEERYDFDWNELKTEDDPFENFPYE